MFTSKSHILKLRIRFIDFDRAVEKNTLKTLLIFFFRIYKHRGNIVIVRTVRLGYPPEGHKK